MPRTATENEAPTANEGAGETQAPTANEGAGETQAPTTNEGAGETQALATKEGPGATAAGASDQTVDGGVFAGWCKTLRMEDLEELHVGLFPEVSKTANTVSTESKTMDMVLLANPAAAEAQSLRVSQFATDAFCAASLLQRTAARYRIAAGASASDARRSVAQSKGIDLGLLFGVSPDAQAIADLCFKKDDGKRKGPDA